MGNKVPKTKSSKKPSPKENKEENKEDIYFNRNIYIPPLTDYKHFGRKVRYYTEKKENIRIRTKKNFRNNPRKNKFIYISKNRIKQFKNKSNNRYRSRNRLG